MSTEAKRSVAGTEDCPICGWDAATINTNVHRKRCSLWQRAIRVLDYSPMVRSEAEDVIDDASLQLKGEDDDNAHAELMIKLLRAFYDRSLGMAIDNNNALDHPPFQEYVAMLDLPILNESVVRGRFPLNEGHIAPGFTIWEPNGSKERRMQFRQAQQRNR